MSFGLKSTILLLGFIGLQGIAFADHPVPPCAAVLVQGTKCEASIKDVRPTQPEVGKREVKSKVKKYGALSKIELEKLKVEKIAPVIIGPDGKFYLIDHHHTVLSFEEIGETHVYLDIKENWSDLASHEPMGERMKLFWKKMEENRKCYLKLSDGTGVNPLSPDFPVELKDCGNNRYRSLVAELLDDGIIKKIEIPYFEFYVSDLLRDLGLQVEEGHFKSAKKQAIAILKTSKAKRGMQEIAAHGGNCALNALSRGFR